MAVTLDTTVGGIAANSYVSLNEAEAFIESHFISTDVVNKWKVMSSDKKSSVLIRAAELLDRYVSWTGEAYSVGQALSWSRAYAYDRDGRLISNSSIPAFLKSLQLETAFWLIQQDGSLPESTAGELDSLKVGPIDISFNQDGASDKTKFLPLSVITAITVWGGQYSPGSSNAVRSVSVVRV